MSLFSANRTNLSTSSNSFSRSQSQSSASNTTANNNIFNPVFAPINNIDISQNDSSTGKFNEQRGDPRVDITANPSTRGGTASNSMSDVPIPPSALPQGQSSGAKGLYIAVGSAGAAYLISYALGIPTSNSMYIAGINGISNLAGSMIAQAGVPGGMLTGVGLGVGGSVGGMYYLGVDLQSSLGIAMAGGVGGASVSYLTAQ